VHLDCERKEQNSERIAGLQHCQFSVFESRFSYSGFFWTHLALWKIKAFFWATYSLQISSNESLWLCRMQRILQIFHCCLKKFWCI